jgi:hypothetical protein
MGIEIPVHYEDYHTEVCLMRRIIIVHHQDDRMVVINK